MTTTAVIAMCWFQLQKPHNHLWTQGHKHWRGRGVAAPSPVFGRSLSPIPTGGQIMPIILFYYSPPGLSDLPTALELHVKDEKRTKIQIIQLGSWNWMQKPDCIKIRVVRIKLGQQRKEERSKIIIKSWNKWGALVCRSLSGLPIVANLSNWAKHCYWTTVLRSHKNPTPILQSL